MADELEMDDIEGNDMDDMQNDLDDLPDDIDDEQLFWSTNLKPDTDNDLNPPSIPGFVIHITSASFGVNVKANSRTVVCTADEEGNDVPLCVLLEGKHETHPLNIVISAAMPFKLQGKNVSPVSLTGYIAPPHGADMDEDALSMDEANEEDIADMDEDSEDLRNMIRKRKLQVARDQDMEPSVEEDESKEPPNKRAKIDGNANKNKQQQQQGAQKNKPQNPNQNKPQNPNQNKNNNPNANKPQPQAPVQPQAQQQQDGAKPSKSQKKKNKKNAKNAANANNADNNVSTTTTSGSNDSSNNNNNEISNNNDNKNENTTNNTVEKQDENKHDGNQNENDNQTPKNPKNSNEGGMKTMKGGIKYKDLKEGDGQAIKQGQKVNVLYVGQLDNKKIFDKCLGGTGFDFTFGKGEVIKGWDMGMSGMKIGGKRRIIVPSALAYGKEGNDNIPPNADLTFTVEVKKAT